MTGVQTCALPILRPVAVWGDAATNAVYVLGDGAVCKLDAFTGAKLRPCISLPHA